MSSGVDRFVEYTTKPHPAFGERTFWKCQICNASGGDEPALSKTAFEMAEAHFEKVALHYSAARLLVSKEDRKSDLHQWLVDEMSMYGQMSAKDAAAISFDIAKSYFDPEIRERDETIERLQGRLAELENPKEG